MFSKIEEIFEKPKGGFEVNLEITYILSQVFIIINYTLIGVTYYAKDRRKILILNIISMIAESISYILLNAWTGFAMCVVAMLRNIIFIMDEKKNGKRETIHKTDIMILLILYAITIIFSIFTYDGFLSLLSVVATCVYTFSVWQKKTKVYKLLGIPTGILWISYNIYIQSIFGIILETILFVCSTTGFLLENKKVEKQS